MGEPAQFVVAGGGTAGWLAALVLQNAVRRRKLDAKVTVIESSKIPTIGVGEGSTAALRVLLRHLEIDEFEFIGQTGATIKYGIRHRDWRHLGQSYDGPIDDPHQVVAAPSSAPSDYQNVFAVAAGRKLADMHLFGQLMAADKSPFARRADGSFVPIGPFHYAYHFDQALVGKYLKSKSRGVALVDAIINGVDRDGASGNITALLLDNGQRLAGDFFVDATGFRRRLIVEELGAAWVSYAKEMPINRAMPFWLDVTPGEEIGPYTLAWAQKAGWLWKIPTRERYGCGYAYSDEFCTPEEAKREIETALGHSIEVRNDIKLSIGRLGSPWTANCLALGLASSFLEPLEATSIHGTIVQLLLFTQKYCKPPSELTSIDRNDYNECIGRQVDDFRTFINIHYAGGRNDTPFWRDVAANRRHPETIERLSLWQREMPKREHFGDFLGGLPHVEAQLHYPVLDGLGLLNKDLARAELERQPNLRAFARKSADDLTAEYRAAAGKAMGHAEFLRALQTAA